MLGKFLDPKNDVAFRRVFGSERNKDILLHFLNDMLDLEEGSRIKGLTFLKTYQDAEVATQKTSIVDILCQDNLGRHYIVEMQVAREKGFDKRAQYYAAKAYTSQHQVKGAYHNLKEVIFLAIADYIVFPKKESWCSHHATLDKHSHEHDLKDFTYSFIELPKFTKPLEELTSIREKWAFFFKYAENTSALELERLIGQDEVMKRAYEELDRFYWNKEELLTYDQAEKYEGAYLASMEQKYDEGLKKGLQKGKEEGLKKGLEKGKMEGLKKGLQKGKEEGLKEGLRVGKLAIAHQLLAQGMSLDAVTAITGLSAQDIQEKKSD